MSSDQGPIPPHGQPPEPPPPSAPPRRNPALTVLMILIGIILLLPGVCAAVFAVGMRGGDSGLAGLWMICFLISAGGIALIVNAVR
jgi:hypothetical protein